MYAVGIWFIFNAVWRLHVCVYACMPAWSSLPLLEEWAPHTRVCDPLPRAQHSCAWPTLQTSLPLVCVAHSPECTTRVRDPLLWAHHSCAWPTSLSSPLLCVHKQTKLTLNKRNTGKSKRGSLMLFNSGLHCRNYIFSACS